MNPLPKEDLAAVTDVVGLSWEKLRGARIFLTGSTGFFGRWLVESFAYANGRLGLNARLVCLSRSPGDFLAKNSWLIDAPGIEWVAGDVRSFAFPEGVFTHVIHAATPVVAMTTPESTEEILDIIVRGTMRTLEFAREKKVARFLLTSSGAVYGRQPESLWGIPETWSGGSPDPASTASAYAEGKRVAETMTVCAAATSGFVARIARCFAFVGPGLPLDTHFAAGNFIRDILAGGRPVLRGNPAVVRSYLYTSDLTAWIWAHLVGDGAPVINVGSDEAVSLGALANRLTSVHLPEVAERYTEGDGSGSRYVPDISNAKAAGLSVRVDLDTAFEKTIRYNCA